MRLPYYSVYLISFLAGCVLISVVWLTVQVTNWKYEKLLMILRDNIDDANIRNDGNIFFMETKDSNFHEITHRQACSIESAGNHEIVEFNLKTIMKTF